jgi:16S rRNA U1498 N3-methylase RsmE
MGLQHIENLLRRYRGQAITLKSRSGGIYEGTVAEITNDYVALTVKKSTEENAEQVFVLLHSIEAVLPRNDL